MYPNQKYSWVSNDFSAKAFHGYKTNLIFLYGNCNKPRYVDCLCRCRAVPHHRRNEVSKPCTVKIIPCVNHVASRASTFRPSLGALPVPRVFLVSFSFDTAQCVVSPCGFQQLTAAICCNNHDTAPSKIFSEYMTLAVEHWAFGNLATRLVFLVFLWVF